MPAPFPEVTLRFLGSYEVMMIPWSMQPSPVQRDVPGKMSKRPGFRWLCWDTGWTESQGPSWRDGGSELDMVMEDSINTDTALCFELEDI